MFKHQPNMSHKSSSEAIQENAMAFVDWSILNTGAYFNNTFDEPGPFETDRTKLSVYRQPGVTVGSVWQTVHPKIIWESNLAYGQPISISGLYVNDTFMPVGSGYEIDYAHGRIYFDFPVNQSSDVRMEFSNKWVSVTPVEEIPFFRNLVTNSYSLDGFTLSEKDFMPPAENRAFPPLVCFDTIHRHNRPYELGTGRVEKHFDIKMHIIAENKTNCERIGSILVDQENKTIKMYDPNLVSASGAYPLDYRGYLNQNPKTFNELVEYSQNGGYFRNTYRIYDTLGGNSTQYSSNVFMKTITWKTSLIEL